MTWERVLRVLFPPNMTDADVVGGVVLLVIAMAALAYLSATRTLFTDDED